MWLVITQSLFSYRVELETMLRLGVKAEIECLSVVADRRAADQGTFHQDDRLEGVIAYVQEKLSIMCATFGAATERLCGSPL